MPQVDLEEYINKINELALATSYVQQLIVAAICGASPKDAKMLRKGIADILDHVIQKKPAAKTLQNELIKYIDFIDRGPPADPRGIFRIIEGGQEDNPR